MVENNPEITERDLLLQLREGDYQAFTSLYNRYARRIYLKLKRLILLPEVAEELHQDIFMAIWNERERLAVDVPFSAILYRKANNLTADFYRKAARDKRLHEQLMAGATELYDQLAEQLDFKETNTLLMAAVAKLPEQRQKVFLRIKMEGKSYEEVAEEFGVSISTVKDHMTRALKFVRTELAQHYPAVLFMLLVEAVIRS